MAIRTTALSILYLLSIGLLALAGERGQALTAVERATVRLSVRKGSSIEYGSGTLVERRGAQGTVVSCGHIFREAGVNPQIDVAAFTDDGERRLEGRLVACDYDSDVSVITVDGMPEVEPLSLADAGHRPQIGEPVTVAGCDLGGPVASWQAQVTALNRYSGYENIEISAIPRDGRSGGGMIDRDMRLIGICSGINTVEKEGIYSSASCVRTMLAKNGRQSLPEGTGETSPELATRTAQPQGIADASEPEIPRAPTARTGKPLKVHNLPDRAGAVASRTAEPPQCRASEARDSVEDRSFDHNPAGRTEVICIIRSVDSSGARNEVIMIDDASRELLEAIARQQGKTQDHSILAPAKSGAH